MVILEHMIRHRWYKPTTSHQNFLKQCKIYQSFEQNIKENKTKPLMLLIGSGGDLNRGKAKLKKPHVNGGSELSIDDDIDYFKGFNKRTNFVDIYGVWKVKGPIRKTEHVKEYIMDMLKKSRNEYIIYYTGHGNVKGDWCFSDGYITFEWLYDTWMSIVPDRRRLTVISDCCYSGIWIDKLKKKKLNPGTYLLFTAAGRCQEAYDNRLSRFLWTKNNPHVQLRTKPGECLNINGLGAKIYVKSEYAISWEKESEYLAFRPWSDELYAYNYNKPSGDAAFAYNYASLLNSKHQH